MNFVGGMYFSGASGKHLAYEKGMGELEPEGVRHGGLISKAWPRPSCPVGEASLVCEALVEKLADQHRVRGVDGVRGGEVVVLAGVDDDPGSGVHLPAEALVDEGAHGVDVAGRRCRNMQSLSIRSSRSRPASTAISGMHRPLA